MMQPNKEEPDIEITPTATLPVGPASHAQSASTPTVTVVAPATLAEGYSFAARVDGREFQVTVPPGGVTEGQVFQVPYPPATSNVTMVPGTPAGAASAMGGAPTGHWRDDLCSCFDVFCSPLFWQALCCTPFLMGQLAQRLRLDCCGHASRDPKGTCHQVTVTFAVYYGLWLIGIGAILWPIFFIYLILLIMNARFQYRRKYQIPPSCCDGCDGLCDDCCCAYWCTCCVSIQMARHTHDIKQYPYQCCTETGLSAGTPEVV